MVEDDEVELGNVGRLAPYALFFRSLTGVAEPAAPALLFDLDGVAGLLEAAGPEVEDLEGVVDDDDFEADFPGAVGSGGASSGLNADGGARVVLCFRSRTGVAEDEVRCWEVVRERAGVAKVVGGAED